ncbi:FG-GAP-like repeat-containing protein [Aegicerativicinus sediminis]|uniref:FG-GAP-like repeat-containing protein n=1 Tax=Aegicerativicinus sediminis TaxID=2893202 RepID=UPI001E4C2DE6|nr:FG-GAP-like repeat-containing protein [Aegicerativicinus sediminis]
MYSLSIVGFAQSFDNCTAASNATAITPGNFTINAINGNDLPSTVCDGVNSGAITAVEWLKYTPTQDHTVVISSDLNVNGDKDTRVNIYTGSCGSLTCLVGDDDSGAYEGTNGMSLLSYIEFNVTSGTTYYIVWNNFWSSNGFDFALTEYPVKTPSDRSSAVTFSQTNADILGAYDRGLFDINGDHLDDWVSIDPTRININLQNANGTYTKVTKTTTLADYEPAWSMAAGDFNADGYADLIYGGSDGATFMKSNQTGNSGFSSVEYIEISGPEDVFCQRTNFVDIDNDGSLDGFACYDLGPSVTYYNDGSGNLTFSNSNGLGGYVSGGNYGSIFIDVDNDGDVDMFMSKCSGGVLIQRKTNELYINNGDGTYTEMAVSAGLADIIQAWSAAWGDFDNDGDLDVVIGSYERNDHQVMRNNGDLTFTDVTPGSGIGIGDRGKEILAGDFNNDGYLDVLMRNSLLYGNGDLTFTKETTVADGAIGDANNDGFLDIFDNFLYINNGNSNNYLKVVAIGDQAGGFSNINGIGARVEIKSTLGTQIRDIVSGVGFTYMSSLTAHFGIKSDTSIEYVKVYWPSGVVDTINSPNINQTLVITEGQTLSTIEKESNSISLYPNPTRDKVYLKSNTVNLQNATFSIYDITGKTIANGHLRSGEIEFSNFSSGHYILKITEGNLTKHWKILKQ